MSNTATSLDQLHDIVMPPAVPWWPLAPGWYAVLGVSALVVCWLALRWWRSWRANAYRRVALRELAAARDAAEVATILRRTALVIAPRAEIATKTGVAWLDWLESQGSQPLSAELRADLFHGVYAPADHAADTAELRSYARTWIVSHPGPDIDARAVPRC